MQTRMIFWIAFVGFAAVGTLALAVTTRMGYETAEYVVIEADGAFEIREYPELTVVATDTKLDAQGRDGSFMRLFRFISGENTKQQKIAMTTPVFMEGAGDLSDVTMSFVLPKGVASGDVPEPQATGVKVQKRASGRFGVVRFPGRLDSAAAKAQEAKLRQWMATKGLAGQGNAEAAGYDPPFTPGFLRRNEILIRIDDTKL